MHANTNEYEKFLKVWIKKHKEGIKSKKNT